MTLADFLAQQQAPTRSHPQTHTWFAAGLNNSGTKTLYIPDRDELRRALLRYVKTAKRLDAGPNSITEKAQAGKVMRFFADIDISAACVTAWAVGREDWRETLRTLLQAGVEKCRRTVSRAASRDVTCILTTRLDYKIHLHFPDVFVDRGTAKQLCAAMKTGLQDDALFEDEDALDDSVYSTGLRLLWCHKGGMSRAKAGKAPKAAEEKTVHEKLYGAGTWTAVYEITDPQTWEKKPEKTMDDLIATSIVAEDTDQITPLKFDASGVGDKKKTKKKPRETIGGDYKKRRTDDPTPSVSGSSSSSTLRRSICAEFTLQESDLNWNGQTRVDRYVTIPTRSRQCEFAAREHASNHVYLLLGQEGVQLRCHDPDCTESRLFPREKMSAAAVAELDQELNADRSDEGQVTEVTHEMRLAALSETVEELKHLPEVQKMNLAHTSSDISPCNVGSEGNYLLELRANNYCAVCRREHDNPQNCILFSMQKLDLLCKVNLRETISVPLGRTHGSIIFGNQIINNNSVNITVGSSDEISADGLFQEVYPIFEDQELNKLLLNSFNGHSYNIAEVIYHLAKDHLGLCESKEVGAWWVFLENSTKWQKDSRLAGSYLSKQIAETYQQVRRWFREHTDDEKLRALRDVKLESIIKRLQDKDKQLILRDAAEVFTVSGAIPMEKRLDQDPFLLGFEGEVYDLRTGTRKVAEATDYVSMSTGYRLPDAVDPDIRAKLEKLISDIQPELEGRDYLLRFLASTLDGCNAEEIFTIWTGNGRNGKGIMQELMMHTLGNDDNGYYASIVSTMLTNERPDSSKPIPDILNLRGKRYVSASEPQEGKQINAGFVKWLTGNDPISGTYKHRNEEIKFRGQHSLVLLCNSIPAMNADDTALWDRARVQDFAMKFVDNPKPNTNERLIDRKLKTVIKDWAPQFMLMLLEAYQRYQTEGLSPPAGILQATKKTKAENDPYTEFIEERLAKTNIESDRLFRSAVNEAFHTWCRGGDSKTRLSWAKPLKVKETLQKTMIAYGFQEPRKSKIQKATGWTWCGIKWKEDPDLIVEESEDVS